MNIVNAVKDSKYLKQDDCGTEGITATIRSITEENLAKEGQPPENKFILHFDECKPLVANSTNVQIIARIVGSEEDTDWIGHRITLYSDPNVSFGGRIVGGIRVRAIPKAAATPKVAPDSGRTTLTAKTRLKNKFKAHPDFGKTDLTAENVNAYFKQLYEHDLNELSEDEAKAGLEDFDMIVQRICDAPDPF